MSEFVLETSHLSRAFGHKLALDDFTLQVEKGGVHALIGSNGAGKSTLFRILLGFLTPNTGSSALLGDNSASLSPATRGRVGYVNEEHTLPGWTRVRDLKQMQQGFYPQWDEDIYRNVIANFDVGTDQKVGSLSRGERAGLNLAMALAQKPELLILDEPTLGLDVVAKQEFLDSLLFSSDMDTTVIYCSHQMEEVERLADHLIILENGRLKCQCPPEEFAGRVQLWITAAGHRECIRENLDNVLSARIIEDECHFYVLDADTGFESTLKLLGIQNAMQEDIGLDAAVRAYLSKHHRGQEQGH